MSNDEFERGLRVIHRALESALAGEGFRNFSVNYTKRGSGPRETMFSVAAQGKTRELVFSREEIDDSASSSGIDPMARSKVHALVASLTAEEARR